MKPDTLEWLARNHAFDSGAAYLDNRFGLIFDEDGDDVDWRKVCVDLAAKLTALASPSRGDLPSDIERVAACIYGHLYLNIAWGASVSWQQLGANNHYRLKCMETADAIAALAVSTECVAAPADVERVARENDDEA